MRKPDNYAQRVRNEDLTIRFKCPKCGEAGYGRLGLVRHMERDHDYKARAAKGLVTKNRRESSGVWGNPSSASAGARNMSRALLRGLAGKGRVVVDLKYDSDDKLWYGWVFVDSYKLAYSENTDLGDMLGELQRQAV